MSLGRARTPLGLRRLILLGVAGASVPLGYLLALDLYNSLPATIRRHRVEWTAAAILAAYALVRLRARRRPVEATQGEQAIGSVDRLDDLSGRVLRAWLGPGIAALAVVWLAIWIPHYLLWPWCRDVDAFATIAQSWDAGELPYRDIRGYNFPGHIYLHWTIGKLFGWGRPWIFYGVDAAALLTLGVVVLAWSRRCFEAILPGAVGYLLFLSVYLDGNFEVVAERDWHTALGATLAILVLQGWPSRRGRWLSAVLAAAAFTIRPHAVIFLPALLDAAIRAGEGSWSRRGMRNAAEWAGAFAVFAAAGFAPLVFAGVLDDFIRNLRIVAYGGPYSTFTPARAVAILGEEVQRPTTAALLLVMAFLSLHPSPGTGKAGPRTWLLAVAAALFYRPLHPVDHHYLMVPLALIGSIAWAVPLAWCLRAAVEGRSRTLRPFPALVLVVLLLLESLPRPVPRHCSLRASLDAFRVAGGLKTPALPPGGWIWYDERRQPFYTWDGYDRLLRYVRATTGPETIVANVLRNPPFPSVNGPTGRRSPFPYETGIAWSWLVDQDLDEEFARQLRQAGEDTIVVWAPRETSPRPRLDLKRLRQVIRDEYEPHARFGLIEVWRRKPKTPPRDPLQSKRDEVPHPPVPQVAPP